MRKDYYPAGRRGEELLIEGLNRNRLLAELSKRGVTVYEMRCDSPRETRVKVTKSDVAGLLAATDKLGFGVTKLRNLGAPTMLKDKLSRLGLLAASLLIIAAYIFASGYVWRVEISGNARVDNYTISGILTKCGAVAGVRKDSLDTKSLESALRGLDGISEATVQMSGMTLKISVLESLDYVPRPQGGKAMLYSGYDAEVTRIILRRGSALVKTGQRVFKGTPLLSGEVVGTDGEVIESGYADGEVYGKAVFCESTTVCLKSVTSAPTGSTKRSTVLSLWGLKIGKRRDGYELADITETARTLAPLPIRVTSITAKELTREEREISREEAIAAAEEELRVRMSEHLITDVEDERLIVRDIGDNLIDISLYVTAEVRIS